MKITHLNNADMSLVVLKDSGNIGRKTPHCLEHGAMLKMTEEGIWRCMTTYSYDYSDKSNIKVMREGCRAGCAEE